MTQTTLEQAIQSFDRSAVAPVEAAAEKARAEILSRFPMEAWPDLPLERYALGQPDSTDTYCRWLEYDSTDLGSIAGGSAQKHIIFKRKHKSGWYFPQRFKSVEEAWEALRADFVTLLARASEDRWQELAELLPFQFGPALTLKTLHIYFPDRILPVYSRDHLTHFRYRLTGEDAKTARKLDPVTLNKAVADVLRARPELSGWTPKELERLLYHWDDPRQSGSVYKIAPGRNAKHWNDCLQNGYVCVGWDRVGDLRSYETFEEFETRFREEYEKDGAGGRAAATRKAKELWLLTKLEPGDRILANQGTSEILAVGEVVDPVYEWLEDRPEYRHVVHVKWDTTLARPVPPQKRWAFLTIAPVSRVEYDRLMNGESDPPPPPPPDPLFAELAELLDERKQLVLYGPPGTGKTYTARRFLLHWLLSQAGEESGPVLVDRDRNRDAWTRLTKPGKKGVAQVTMLTFHPSYSYEDFVEGYRPQPAEGSGLKLALEDGIFKRVCREARETPLQPFVVFIDEINRANLPKVLGELITVLEADKRGLSVTLPQSKELFSIPENVYIVGTMNTADRSIKVLDAAIRRRFAFHELMPQVDLLAGVQFGDLALDAFLDYLNARISKKEGREKQIGHSVFFVGEDPVSQVEEFARRIKHEVIPLLQEYCYEDYTALADYLGNEVVNEKMERLNSDLLQQPQALADALARLIAKDSGE
ncbi:MAG: AAA family ATPase [Vicinamibacterales bacterium]|nr:AAA family ATPase [Vicinamibacterales bacterium]